MLRLMGGRESVLLLRASAVSSTGLATFTFAQSFRLLTDWFQFFMPVLAALCPAAMAPSRAICPAAPMAGAK
jgi:hypothetical protein